MFFCIDMISTASAHDASPLLLVKKSSPRVVSLQAQLVRVRQDVKVSNGDHGRLALQEFGGGLRGTEEAVSIRKTQETPHCGSCSLLQSTLQKHHQMP